MTLFWYGFFAGVGGTLIVAAGLRLVDYFLDRKIEDMTNG